MSLFSSLYVGNSGLQTSMNALNTVAHNLVNTDTAGYTRQQVQQSDKSYITISKTASAISYQQAGLGVSYSNVKQVRDYFLDKTYRTESGRCNFYDISANVLTEVEDQLGELNGEAFQTTLANLWTAVQELSKDPCNSVTQGTLVQQSAEFIKRARAIYDGLSSYQDNLNSQIKQYVGKINDIGAQIQDLNDQIRKIESGGIERANDMRDTRNMMLDELAGMVDISYAEDTWGNVSIQIEGEDFLKGSTLYPIFMQEDETNKFITPYWPQNAEYRLDDNGEKVYYDISNALVFNLNQTISTDLGTDIGGLKALMYARGDHRADYSDVENHYDQVSQSVLMNIQAEFDQLIHSITTRINDVLSEAAGVKETDATAGLTLANLTFADGTTDTGLDADGNPKTYHFVRVDECDYLSAQGGYPLQLFSKTTTDAYRMATATINYPDGTSATTSVWVYNEEDPAEKASLYTVSNTDINQELMQSPANLGFRLKDGSEDNATIEKIKAIFTEEGYSLNPSVVTKVNLMDYYDNLVAQVANSTYVFSAIHENQANTVESAQSARDQITAVSSDEELSNMIKFQSAYNASSRFINVVDEMLEHMITSLT